MGISFTLQLLCYFDKIASPVNHLPVVEADDGHTFQQGYDFVR